MSTAHAKPKTLFLNGVEVDAVEATGNHEKDLAAAKQFLAEKGIDKPQERLTVRPKVRRAWFGKFR